MEIETEIARIETGVTETGVTETVGTAIEVVEAAVMLSLAAIEEIGENAPESNARLAWNVMFVRNAKDAQTEKVEASESVGRSEPIETCEASAKDALSVNLAWNAKGAVNERFAATENLEENANLAVIVVTDARNVSRGKLVNRVNHEASELAEVTARNVQQDPNASLVENAVRANAKSDWNGKVDDLRVPTVTRKKTVIWDEAMPWPITISRWMTMMMTMHRSRSRRLSAPS